MTIEEFLQLPLEMQTTQVFQALDEREQNKLFSKAMYAAKRCETSLQHIIYAVIIAEKNGVYDKVKFGGDIYQTS